MKHSSDVAVGLNILEGNGSREASAGRLPLYQTELKLQTSGVTPVPTWRCCSAGLCPEQNAPLHCVATEEIH